MSQLIIYKDGAYNFYTTVADGPCFKSALTLEQVNEYIKGQFGESGIANLSTRIERAHKTGCSEINGMTLRECISGNRAGKDETEMPYDDFIAKYLTI